MRPGLVAAGAGLLVLGAALIAVAPIYASSGFYREEFQFASSGASAANATKAAQGLADAANQAVIVAFSGAALAAVGGGVAAFGVTADRAKREKGASTPAPSPQSTGHPEAGS